MRLLWAIIKLAVRNLWANKLRSFLTVLGIMIGVASVIAMLSIGTGAQIAMENQIRGFGANTLVLIPEYRNERGSTAATFERLTLEDGLALLKEVPEIHSISPEVSRGVQVKYGNRNTRTEANGVSAAFVPMRNYAVEYGRNFSSAEEKGQRKVVLLGYKIINELFGGDAASAVGEEVKLDGQSYRVIGTLAERGDQGFAKPDDVILIPYSTAMRRLVGTTNVFLFHIKVETEDQIEDAIMGINRVMRKRHKITEGNEDDFAVFSSKDALQSLGEVAVVFTLLLSGIASISLLVGGIGIMNIMLVTVIERTREIGIRKALGAKRRHIMQQFLVESVVISLIGGFMGMTLGSLGGLAARQANIPAAPISIQSVLLASGFCMCIGIFFGIYPARKASRLDPIEALRYE